MNILEEELLYAVRDSLLEKMRREANEKLGQFMYSCGAFNWGSTTDTSWRASKRECCTTDTPTGKAGRGCKTTSKCL